MGEKRAVPVSHGLWKEIMTKGYTNGVRCTEGIPEDATLHLVTLRALGGKSDPVFVFESDSWESAASSHTIQIAGQAFPAFVPEFRVTECRTCKWWEEERTDIPDVGVCANRFGKKVFLDGGMLTTPDFGCTLYEPRETND